MELKRLLVNPVATSSRGQKHIPKLTYTVNSKWVIVGNHQALSQFTKRSIKFIAAYFASKLGVSYELEGNDLKYKGAIKLPKFKEIENKFYKEQILCFKCFSPDTIRDESSNAVECLSCFSKRIVS